MKSGTIGASCAYYDVLRSLERVKLSDRELKVLSFTLEGESARSIGEHLGVSAPTVGSYRQRGYKKMGVSSKKS
ncbi:MAG: helix-turn-helix transcriptional regulator [Collinsella sp.]